MTGLCWVQRLSQKAIASRSQTKRQVNSGLIWCWNKKFSSGALSSSPPTAAGGALSYAYDPADPVPTVGGDNLEIACGPLDQRKIEALGRADVLVFTSAPLAEPLAITAETKQLGNSSLAANTGPAVMSMSPGISLLAQSVKDLD